MKNLGVYVSIFIVAAIVFAMIVFFPAAGCSRAWNSWKAKSYGADFLVVQYSQDGRVMQSWELREKSVASEDNSDGIYFTDNEGNVVHLSGHYVYVQVEDWEAAREKFVEGRERK